MEKITFILLGGKDNLFWVEKITFILFGGKDNFYFIWVCLKEIMMLSVNFSNVKSTNLDLLFLHRPFNTNMHNI